MSRTKLAYRPISGYDKQSVFKEGIYQAGKFLLFDVFFMCVWQHTDFLSQQ